MRGQHAECVCGECRPANRVIAPSFPSDMTDAHSRLHMAVKLTRAQVTLEQIASGKGDPVAIALEALERLGRTE